MKCDEWIDNLYAFERRGECMKLFKETVRSCYTTSQNMVNVLYYNFEMKSKYSVKKKDVSDDEILKNLNKTTSTFIAEDGTIYNGSGEYLCEGGSFVCNPKYSVTKKGTGAEVSKILSYAYDISGDKDFVKTLVAENGTVDVRRQSDYHTTQTKTVKDENGEDKEIEYKVREPSFGICQIHCGYHKDKCGSYTKPTWEGFYDWKWQADTCYKMYKEGTKFYGRTRFENDPVFNQKLNNILTFNH